MNIDHYEAIEFPRGNLVIEMPTREVVFDAPTMTEANQLADRMNGWLERRPDPEKAMSHPWEWEETGEVGEQLAGILDRMLGPEQMEFQEAA